MYEYRYSLFDPTEAERKQSKASHPATQPPSHPAAAVKTPGPCEQYIVGFSNWPFYSLCGFRSTRRMAFSQVSRLEESTVPGTARLADDRCIAKTMATAGVT